MSALLGLVLAVVTSTAAPTGRPLTAYEAALDRALTACEGDLRLADTREAALTAELADVRGQLERERVRLVESPPPAEPPPNALLRILGASAGAGLGAGGAALACAEGRCSALGGLGATALGGALGALAGGLVTEWLSP
jgi:hypothetical protein